MKIDGLSKSDFGALSEEFFEFSKDGVTIIELENEKYLNANSAALKMLGYSLEELLNLSPKRILHQDQETDLDDPNYSAKLHQILREEGSLSAEVILAHKSGYKIYCSLSSKFVIREGKELIISLLKDNTELKLKEKELLKQNSFLKALFDHSLDGLVLTDKTSGEILMINQVHLNQTGYTLKEFRGESDLTKFFIEDEEEALTNLEKFAQLMEFANKEDPKLEVLKHKKKSGSFFYAELKLSEISIENKSYLFCVVRDVTKWHLAKKKIEKSNAMFQGVFENSGLGIAIIDHEAKIIRCNKAYGDMLGYSTDEMEGRNCIHMTILEDRPLLYKGVEILTSGSQNEVQIEKRYLKRDGSIIWAKVTSSLLENSDEPVIISVIENITDQVENLSRIRQNEERLKHAASMASLGYWDFDILSKEITWSQGMYDVLEANSEEIIPGFDAFESFVDESAKGKVGEAWDLIRVKNRTIPIEIPIISGKGNKKVLRGSTKILTNKKGEPIKAIGIVQDITQEKSTLNALRLSEGRFRRLAENSPNIIFRFRISPSPVLEYVSPAIEDMFGYKPKDVCNKEIDVYSYIVDKDLAFTLARHLAEGKWDEHVICQLLKADGQPLWVDIKCSPVFDANSEIEFFEGVITDIDGLKKNEQKLIEQKEELITKNNELEQFTYISSHDLRSPVVNLTTLLEMFEEDNFSDYNADILKKVNTTAQKMYETLHDLIDVIALQRKTTSPFETVKIRHITDDILSQLSELIRESSAQIVYDFDIESFDYVRIHVKSILHNLVSNAIKYRSKERNCEIKISSKSVDGFVKISVADNGLGLDIEKLGNRLFGMFQVFHKTKEGKGLGLYIIKKQVEQFGGRIEVQSEINKGSEFQVYLKTDV